MLPNSIVSACTEIEVCRRYRSLCGTFRQELNRVEGGDRATATANSDGNGAGNSNSRYRTSWRYYNRLLYLKEGVREQQSRKRRPESPSLTQNSQNAADDDDSLNTPTVNATSIPIGNGNVSASANYNHNLSAGANYCHNLNACAYYNHNLDANTNYNCNLNASANYNHNSNASGITNSTQLNNFKNYASSENPAPLE